MKIYGESADEALAYFRSAAANRTTPLKELRDQSVKVLAPRIGTVLGDILDQPADPELSLINAKGELQSQKEVLWRLIQFGCGEDEKKRDEILKAVESSLPWKKRYRGRKELRAVVGRPSFDFKSLFRWLSSFLSCFDSFSV